MELYTGSGAGEKGLEGRLSQYASMQAGTRKRQDGPHCDLLMKKGVKVNFCVVSTVRPERQTKPYVMLAELAHTILLKTWDERAGKYLPKAAMDAMNNATPLGLGPKKYTGLNRAAQMLQGLTAKTKTGTCANCGTTESYKNRWYNTMKGLPFMQVVCRNCYQWSWKTGTARPAEKRNQLFTRDEEFKDVLSGWDLTEKGREIKIRESQTREMQPGPVQQESRRKGATGGR
ncbi:hypothetical protein LTR92_003245 [Exophiala xenobiotica]|nr:hypothetical protein LTR92_003245 [Exophiala xenobiotica]KAK5213677.1 hypothetical protein LTR41_001257 [Exophiala xenobiotica]